MAHSLTRSETQIRTVLIFLLPSLIGFMVFIFIPAVAVGVLSLFHYSGSISHMSFAGLQNYARALASAEFWSSLWVTIRFVVASVAFQLFFGFVFAMMLNRALFARNFFRGLIFMPSVLSKVAVAVAFVLILHPTKGPMNSFLESLGMDALPWLASADTSLISIIMVVVWQNSGYYMVLFLAGLLSISQTLYDSADIDGANWFQKMRRITIPMLSPTTFFCVVMAVIRAFQVFDQVFIMTGGQDGGGPRGSTNVLVFDIYKNAFIHFDMGYASAESMILLIIVLSFTVWQYRRQSKWVNYDVI
jgi:multiple sugar transport system permease protein